MVYIITDQRELFPKNKTKQNKNIRTLGFEKNVGFNF